MPTPVHRQPIVAVFGSSTLQETDPAWREARDLGSALARRGLATMTGGYGGAMAAVSRGAHEAGGHVIGVTVEIFERRGPVNPWVRERVHTPDLFERLRHIVHSADAFVVVAGSIGTLTELFLAWTLLAVNGRPRVPLVVLGDHWPSLLDAHRHPEHIPPHLFEFVQLAADPVEAARLVLAPVAHTVPGRP